MTKFANDSEQFKGFARPNYTPVPDELFDELLAFLTGAELKVLLYIIRRTFGFKRDADAISLSQMLNGIQKMDGTIQDHGAGLSKPTLLQALRTLQERGIVIASRRRSTAKGDEPTVYTLRFRTDDPGQILIPPVVKNFAQGVVKEFIQGGGQESSPGPWSKNLTTQETGLQETDRQETDGNPSKFRKGSRQGSQQENSEGTEDPHSLSRQQVTPPTQRRRAQTRTTALETDQLVEDTGTPRSDRFSVASEPPTQRPVASPCPRGFTRLGEVLADTTAARQAADGVSSSAASTATAAGSEDASPQYIDNVIRDLSHELSDSAHVRANVTQALHLWEQSGLSVKAFVEVLYAVRRTTRLQADVKKPMPYLFKLVRVELGLAPNPQKNQPRIAAKQSSPAPAARGSLAGRYAHLVRR